MRRTITTPLLLCLFSAVMAQNGQIFPPLSGETLDEKHITIPTDTKGKTTLIGMAYSRKSEEMLRTWYAPVYDKFVLKRGMFDHTYDVNLFFVPMYIGLNQTAYSGTLKELKSSNRKDLFPYLLFYKGELEPYGSQLKLSEKDVPYFFVLDQEGKIIYATKGIYQEAKMEAIEEAIDSNSGIKD